MANDQVQKTLDRFLVLTQTEVKATVQTPMESQPESPTKEIYIRKISADPVPGRVRQATVQDVVDALNESLNRSKHDLRQAATQIGLAFHAFEEVHVREQGLTALQDVVTVLQRMGDPPVPHGETRYPRDPAGLCRVPSGCGVEITSRQLWPTKRRAAQFPAYESAFNRGDLSTSQLHSVDDLQNASRRSDRLLEIKETVLNVESGLDTHDYQAALIVYEDLYSKESSQIPAVRAYLAESQPLLGDLKDYVTLTTRKDNLSVTLTDELHRLDIDQRHLADLSGHPVTKAYLRKDTESRKADLIAEIASIPPIQVDPVTLPFEDGKGKRIQQATLPELGRRLNEMQAALKAQSDIVGLVDQPEIMEFVRSNFSSSVYDSLAEKVKRVEANQLVEMTLASEYSKKSLQEQQAAEKRRREVDQREELATELVNTAVIITKLEESFQSTHLMGYSIEESKSRKHFRDLVEQNRGVLTSTVKEAIKQHFRQILPGLTVEEASLVRQILSTIDISINAW